MEKKLHHSSLMPRDFTFHLLKQITNNFSEDNRIGFGGYGAVYKGVLENGIEIAVKKLYNHYPELDNGKQFLNECSNLMVVQHQNIVRLIGYCYEIRHKFLEHEGRTVLAEVEERALCFEYLKGGTLDSNLSDESRGLDWCTRFKIIKGICEGLNFLHNGSEKPIFHLDLKPANILLDQNMIPKIADFGLSRLFDSTRTCTTKGIIGTPGYMPPEYINRFQITKKFDVFSLGVIIIKMMAGPEGYSKCVDMPSEEFINLVHKNWGKRFRATISLHASYGVKKCIDIALRCVEVDRVKRPTIAEIVDELNKIDINILNELNMIDTAKYSPTGQMPFTPLSEINQASKRWEVRVFFSRLWCYRGGTDKGPIKHMDAVVLDQQGTCMYAQISAEAAKRFEHILQEGKVYGLRNILVSPSKTAFRAVEAKNMINITKYTTITEMPDAETEFPLCTYNLTAFTELPKPAKAPTNFVDVIGKIVAVSQVFEVHPSNQLEPSSTRTVVLQDLLGHEMKLILWGERAVEFDADQVVSAGAEEHVVAIFVGTLPKMVEGAKGLSGSAACRWYINEDIPDINSFKSSLGDKVLPVIVYTPPGLNLGAARARTTPKEMTVKELSGLNPFEDSGLRYFCDVTVTRLCSNQRWWFCSCITCHKSAAPGVTDYTCSNPGCASKDADPTYSIAVMASDGTEEAEFVFFDKIGRAAAGKPLMTLLRQNHPGIYPVIEVVKAARFADGTPIEISRLVGQKYRLVVSISAKSFTSAHESLSFQVNRIEHTTSSNCTRHFLVAQLPLLAKVPSCLVPHLLLCPPWHLLLFCMLWLHLQIGL